MSDLSKERARLGDDKEPILVERLMRPRRPLAVKAVVLPAKRQRAATRG
jgi:hypothetical protein